MELKVLSGRKLKSKINPLDFRRDFFKDLLSRIPHKNAIEALGVQTQLSNQGQHPWSTKQSIPMCRKSSKHGRRPAWINTLLLTGFKYKKEVNRRLEQGHTASEGYTHVVGTCRNVQEKFQS